MSPVPSIRDRFGCFYTASPILSRSGSHHTTAFPPRCNAHSRTWLLHLFDTSLAERTECSHPTVFTGLPLLTGSPIHYVLWTHVQKTHLVLATQAWGSALGCVSGRLAPPFLVGLTTSIQHPIYLHAGIRLSCLILAYYSCRSRSPVCSKARDATPDFDYAPLYDPLLSQRGLPTFAESFWDSVAYFVDLLRFTEYRHTLRLFTVKAATGGAC